MFLTIISCIIAFILLFYIFLIWNFDYWKKRGIVSPKPLPFVGNYPSVLTQKRHMAYDLQDIYEKYKHTDNFVGIFSCRSPQLLITNGELVRRIYSTDFKHFHDNEASRMVDDKSDFLFANNPFSLTGEKWRERRAEITPGLTISRVKTVYPITQRVCKNMTKFIEEQMKMVAKDGIEAKDLSLRFTSEVVTDCVLGLEAKSFSPKPSPIMTMITQIFEQNFIFIFYTIILGLFPSLSNFIKIRFFPKKSEEFFVKIMQDSVELRRSQKEQGVNESRVDFLNYILQLQEKKKLSTLDLAAHTMTFLSDGFETTGSVLSHALLLLGRDLERQQKLREEILDTIGDKEDFDSMMDLPYLDACIHETIRLFPPGFFSNKLCTEPIELLNKNGKSLVLSKNTVVVLPLHSIMVDGDYYTNPNDFEPERFLEENGGLKKYKDLGVYYGFGEGPRACLGMRFALAQLKSALVDIMRQFEVRVNVKTRKDNELDPKYFLSRLNGGIWLDFKKI
ncbi:probable cytochrome P450 28a5 [Calliphora vicina]|uniref:probable cytochrome P450 28a5 n=1 Tax=Calliphora vicina TaxID=7373 RepID=UPI00325C16CA